MEVMPSIGPDASQQWFNTPLFIAITTAKGIPKGSHHLTSFFLKKNEALLNNKALLKNNIVLLNNEALSKTRPCSC